MSRWLWVAFTASMVLDAQPSSIAGRNADLSFVSTQLPALDKNFFAQLSRDDFAVAIANLQADLPALTDPQFYVRLAQLVAMAGDAHTYLYLSGAPGFQILPLHLRWLDDGVFVTSAGPEYLASLGTRIVSIGGVPIADVVARLGTVIPHDNDQWLHYMVQSYLVQQQILEGLGIVPAQKPSLFTFERLDGTQFTLAINASTEARISLLSAATGSIPDYLTNTSQNYWYSYSDATRMLYFKYNVCENDPSNPFPAFAANVLETIDSNPVDTLVFDFRGNTGGDSSVINPLMNGVVQRLPGLRIHSSFRLYAAVDKGTFSSGLDDAELFKQPSLAATVIGEPTGGKPAHYGNVASFTLPSSRIQGQYSQQFFSAPSYLPAGDASLRPDVTVPIRSTDYFARFDPVMAAILARSPGLSRSTSATGSVTIVNAASERMGQGIAAGSLAVAFGTFATVPDRVDVGDVQASIVYSSRSQVLFLVPETAVPGNVTVNIEGAGSQVASGVALLTADGPGIFTWRIDDPQQPGVVEDQNSTFDVASRPATAGDSIRILATGINADSVQVFFGDYPADGPVTVAPASLGTWLVTAQIPQGPLGLTPVFLIVGKFASNAVTITVQ